MISDSSILCSLSVSPFTSDKNANLNNQIVSKKKIFSCSKYPSEKKEIQSIMNIKNINNCYHFKKSMLESSIYQSKPKKQTENNQDVKKEIITDNSVDSNVNNKKKDMKKIMRNTNLVCSFLRTFSVNILKNENDNVYNKEGSLLNKITNNDLDFKKHESRSLERFVSIILTYTILDEIFVYVSLLFVHRYLNIKARIEEVRKKTVNNSLLRNKECFQCKIACKNFSKLKFDISKNKTNKFLYLHKYKKKLSNLKMDTKMNFCKSLLKIPKQQSNSSIKDDNKKLNSNNNNNNNNNNNLIHGSSLPKQKMINSPKDLILAAMICASKCLDDNPYSNIAWQKLTKRSINSIFELEREFLMTINYKLYFSDTEWHEWEEWITNYKLLLESSIDSGINMKYSSQSCISIPSQTCANNQDKYNNNNDNNSTNDINEYKFIPMNICTFNNHNLPSPYSTQNIIPDAFPVYNIPFTFNKEKPRNINSISYQDNAYLPSLSSRDFSIENYYSPYSTVSLCSPISPHYKDYLLYCEENNPSQNPLLYNSFYSMENYNNYNFSEDKILQNKLLNTSYNTPNEFLYSYSTLEKNYSQYDYNIDTTLFNQNNYFIDFSEIIPLYQKKNLNFKRPVFPPL